MADSVRIRGLRELQRAFAAADKDLAKDLRDQLREAAKPVAEDAERLTGAGSPIANLSPGDDWADMRVGVTRRSVYVAPKKRGRRGSVASRRPNLAPLLMDDAMQPALDQNADDVERAVEKVLERIEDRWAR